MTNEQMIAAFGSKIGLPAAKLTNDGTCTFTIDGSLELIMEGEHHGKELLIWVDICPLFEADRAMMQTFLTGNFTSEGTGLGSIALHPTSQDICVVRHVDVSKLNVEEFVEVVTRICRTAKVWIDYLPKMSRTEPSALPFEEGFLRV